MEIQDLLARLDAHSGSFPEDLRSLINFSRNSRGFVSTNRVVRDSAFDLPQLPMPFRDVARCLGASVEGDPELQSKLAALLQEKGDQMGAPWEGQLHSAVIEGLLSVSHNVKQGSVGVAQITSAVNYVLAGHGESLQLTARAVGSLLRQMGFSTRRLGATGRGITLLSSIRERIHSLAEDYGLLGRLSAEGCAECIEWIESEERRADEREFAREVKSSKDNVDERELNSI